jgi:hypothetical protein
MAQTSSTENAKKLLKELCYKVLSSPIFVNDVFRKNFGVKDISITRSKIFNIMINCAIELFEKIVKEEKLDFERDSILENKLAVHYIMACLIIALKMYGAHDWIKDENIIPSIVKFVKLEFEELEFEITVDPRELLKLEGYILKMTDWKGCESYKLIKNYDADFSDEKDPVLVDDEGNIVDPIFVNPYVYETVNKDVVLRLIDEFLEETIKKIKEEIDKEVNKEVVKFLKNFSPVLVKHFDDKNEKLLEFDHIKSKLKEYIQSKLDLKLRLKIHDINVRKQVEKRISDGRYTSDKIKDYEKNGKKSIAYQGSSAALKRMPKSSLSRSPLSKSSLSKSSLSKSSLFRSTLKKKSKRSKSIKKK